jgi:hypothetical protein
VRFQVLTAASMMMTVFWVVASCSQVEMTDISEVLTTFIIRVITVNFYENARRNIPEVCQLEDKICRCWSSGL